jgi:hypothetical protein
MSAYEITLSHLMCGRIMDIVLRNGKVCLLSGDSEVVWAIPLVCPVCGQPWHFVSDDMEKTLAQLRKKLKRFNLVHVSYIGSTSVEYIEQTMEMGYSNTSDLFQDLVDEVPTHVGIQKDFPAVSLTLEKKHRKLDSEDIMLVIHPTAILESVEITGWQEDD